MIFLWVVAALFLLLFAAGAGVLFYACGRRAVPDLFDPDVLDKCGYSMVKDDVLAGKDWLEHRADVLPWIEKFSPAGLLRACTAAKAPVFLYTCPALPKAGELPADPTHAAMFCVKFEEICKSRGIACRRGNDSDLFAELKK